MSKVIISAVVLTKNEETNITQCLNSLSWCDEVIVIDDYSEDKTLEKVTFGSSSLREFAPRAHSEEFTPRSSGRGQSQKSKVKSIKIYKRHLNGDFAAQRNYGLSKVKGDWVLFADADEVIDEGLQHEIKKITQQSAAAKCCDGYYLWRRDYFLGKWLKYGETANVKLLRLAKKNVGYWQGRVHETWNVKGKTAVLKESIRHYPHSSISDFLRKVNNYTDLVAQCWMEQGRKIVFWEIIVYPAAKFIQNYFLRLGFLDGMPGLIMAIMMSFHSFLARSKLWLLRHKKTANN